MGKRTRSPEFKREAVRQVLERGVARARVARELGLHVNVLKRWLEQHAADPPGAFNGVGRRSVEGAELERLRRELFRTKAERDILKKAIACFTKDAPAVAVHCPSSAGLAGALAVRRTRRLAQWFLRVAYACPERAHGPTASLSSRSGAALPTAA